MNFKKKLEQAIAKNNSLLCIGLDTDFTKIPKYLLKMDDPIFAFNKAIIDATSDLVCCYKANVAFYLASDVEGIVALKMTADYLKNKYAGIPLILDGKWVDIGNTAEAYAKFAFDIINADAVTVNPYLGFDAIEPFLKRGDKGVFVHCRSSNPGAGEIQDLVVDGQPLYVHIAKKAINEWNVNNNCMLVVGVIGNTEIKILRDLSPTMIFLVPGIGAQGGDLGETLKNGLTKQKSGLIIHSSRTIIYASNKEDFAKAARAKAQELRDEINTFRQ